MNARYIPENGTMTEKYNAVVYAYTSGVDGKPAAVAYIGKQSKAYFHYRFMNEAQRAEHVEKFFGDAKRLCEYKAERKAGKQAAHTIKVGDILYASWGYEQTNINFFQVVAVTKGTVTFGEIAQNVVDGSRGFMCENVTARKDAFLNEKRFTRRADGNNSLSFAEHKDGYKYHLSPYDGRPLYQSHYA